MPTMNEVARRAGVSVSTVSYALRGARAISDQTRARLAQGTAELDYQPNARGLAARQNRVLRFVCPPRNSTIGAPDLIFIFVDIDFRPTVLRGVDYLANLGQQQPVHLLTGRRPITCDPDLQQNAQNPAFCRPHKTAACASRKIFHYKINDPRRRLCPN